MNGLRFTIVIFALFLTYSCGTTTKKEKEQKSELNPATKNACDEFLAHYEEWIDAYLVVIDTYFNNPSDEATASQYLQLMQEGLEWSTKWEKLFECADDEQYKQRFAEISKEVENKLEELGL